MVINMDPDYEALHPYFGWLPFDMVKETFAHTTPYARMSMNSVYSDTPAIASGGTYAQLSIGTESHD
jgi:hypothetical protein